MILVWKVKVGKESCIFAHFESAWYDWKTHDGIRWVYPVLMSKDKFINLPEHGGW